MRLPKPHPAGPNQESVWDYPRPPCLEPTDRHIQIEYNGLTLADSRRTWRVLETSHPPVYYIPQDDINMAHVVRGEGSTWCEWKGQAIYFDVIVGDRAARRVAWSYPNPVAAFSPIKDCLAFYAWAMDRCLVDGDIVIPQPGNFYGGWISVDIIGPFKGEPGSTGW